MKYITLIIGLLVVGCGKQEQTDANKSTPTTNINEVSGTTEKPVKELTKEDVVGTYEAKIGENFVRMVYLKNGICKLYANSRNEGAEDGWSHSLTGSWKIVEGQMRYISVLGQTEVHRINKDGSMTVIAVIAKDGQRTEMPKENQQTYKKIK